MKRFRLYIMLVTILPLTQCIETQSSKGQQPAQSADQNPAVLDPNAVVSLSGKVFPEKPLSDEVLHQRREELAIAQRNYEAEPNSEENIIWYGRRLAYLGRYHEAIRIFSVGIDKYPSSYRLLRHRGHRYITIRKFDKAIEDLQSAAFYARPIETQTEPDGLPNRLNIPLSNTKFNIWYHLGLAYYLKGNYDKAISAYKKCMTYSDNDDLLVATTDWFYMTYRKIGNLAAADELLSQIERRMTIIENNAYHQRLLMYKGLLDAEDLLDEAAVDEGVLEPTLGYGVANWHLYNGQTEQAKAELIRIVNHPSWDAFGYIAAEVDLLALGSL